MPRVWLHGHDNIQECYLLHNGDYNIGLIMRVLTSSGTPELWADAKLATICLR